jgi:hypothetical protein
VEFNETFVLFFVENGCPLHAWLLRGVAEGAPTRKTRK